MNDRPTSNRPGERIVDHRSSSAPDDVGTRPLGAVVGAAGGAAAGAMGGMAFGPVGSLAGSLVGAVLGGSGGSLPGGSGPSVAADANSSQGSGSGAQRIHASPAAESPLDDHNDPAVRYGVQAYNFFRGGCDFTDVQDELASHWEEVRGESRQSWEQALPTVRAAWLRTGKVAQYTLSSDSPDQGLQYRAPVDA